MHEQILSRFKEARQMRHCIFSDSIIPAVKQLQGFKGALWLKDANTDKGIGITLWETEANRKASQTSGYYQEQLAKFALVMAGSSTREVYEAIIYMEAPTKTYGM